MRQHTGQDSQYRSTSDEYTRAHAVALTGTDVARSSRFNRMRVATAAFALVAVAACGDKGNDTALNSDTALGRDLAMAAADSATQPKLEDVPVTPPPTNAPVATAPRPRPRPTPTRPAPSRTPAPTPAPARASSGTIAAGTTMTFASSGKVCSNTTAVGEKFTAPLSQSVAGSNGSEIPAGATGTFEVLEAKTAKNSNDQTTLKVRLVAVSFGGQTYPVETTMQNASTVRERSASKGTDAKKVLGGAAAGAIIGQVIGKNTKGTVIGAAAGAAAGTAAAAATADYDTCINNGASITVVLDSPATVRIG